MDAQVKLWPHQDRAINGGIDAALMGAKALCITAPTGAGKTKVITRFAAAKAELGMRVGLFTNRKIITKQSFENFADAGLNFGVVAAGYEMDLLKKVQVVSIQTALSRVERKKKFDWPPFHYAIIDEAHNKAFDPVIRAYRERPETKIIGVTATPVNLGKRYDKLYQFCTMSEARDCGALVPCYVYAPSEPDLRGVRRETNGEYNQRQLAEAMMGGEKCWLVWADVISYFKSLNPKQYPSVLFAPGVKESQWFADQFNEAGIRAMHVDGDTPQEHREHFFAQQESGDIVILCTCDILKEGADLPWIRHAVLCRPCSMVQTYLQMVGRVLRKVPGKELCVLQDHAGCFWKHGSPNIDREWQLGDTAKEIKERRYERIMKGEEAEPIRCPKCAGIRRTGPKCPHCGYQSSTNSRRVILRNGRLKNMRGPIFKPRKPKGVKAWDEKTWKSTLFACARSRRGMTMKQAAAWFKNQTGQWPSQSWKLTPARGSHDWNRLVSNVYPWMTGRKAAV